MTYRLPPNRVALGCRLLARNLALGLQSAAGRRQAVLCEPAAFRAAYVEGLGTFLRRPGLIPLTPPASGAGPTYALPWTRVAVRLVA